MEALAFGQTSGAGGRLIGAALAALAVGLLPYGAFLLLVRAHWALGEGRGPAAVALGTAVLGAALMLSVGSAAQGEARLVAMGAAHSAAYVAGACLLGAGLSRRTGERLVPAGTGRALAGATALGLAGWWALSAIDPGGRVATLGTVAVLTGAGALLYLGLVRRPGAVGAG
jgi:peptidoglycan biosynthesis protein MviN/MurJ (putative lipid II flippase)